MMATPTAEYFQKLLSDLLAILPVVSSSLDNSKSALLHQWMIDVLKTTSKSYPELRRCDQFDAFLRAAIATERSAIIKTFLQHFATPHGIQFDEMIPSLLVYLSIFKMPPLLILQSERY